MGAHPPSQWAPPGAAEAPTSRLLHTSPTNIFYNQDIRIFFASFVQVGIPLALGPGNNDGHSGRLFTYKGITMNRSANTFKKLLTLTKATLLGLALLGGGTAFADTWYNDQGSVLDYWCDDASQVCAFRMTSGEIHNPAGCAADSYSINMDSDASRANFAILTQAFATGSTQVDLLVSSQCSMNGRVKVRSIRVTR